MFLTLYITDLKHFLSTEYFIITYSNIRNTLNLYLVLLYYHVDSIANNFNKYEPKILNYNNLKKIKTKFYFKLLFLIY